MYRDLAQHGISGMSSASADILFDCDFQTTEERQILKQVFTGHASDLSLLMSDDAPREVKEFVRERLLGFHEDGEDGFDAAYTRMREENPDAIFETMPYRGESMNSYERRVQKMMDDEKQAVSDRKKLARLRERDKELGITNDD